MASEELVTLTLHDDFYKDSFKKIIIAIVAILVAIALCMVLTLYLYLHKPPPVTFKVDNEMRVQPPVPLNQPYLARPDLLQWVADVLPRSFVLDFNYYDKQLLEYKPYFTDRGWQAFKNQLNIFANFNDLLANKLFVTCIPSAAPYILNDKPLEDTNIYAWWVQAPLTIKYDGYKPPSSKNVTFQVLVIRVSTLNNLSGVAIDNIVQAPEGQQSI